MRTLIFSLALCVAALAQDTTATLEGQVTDPSGAVIVGASVQAVNSRTGYSRTQATTGVGAYHLTLPVGEYDLLVSAPNFITYKKSSILLNVGQTARLDVELDVGGNRGERVDVEVPLVDNSSTVIGNVVTGRDLV